MKKLIKTLLCLGTVLVLSCALSCFVSAKEFSLENLTYGDYTYDISTDNTEIRLKSYRGNEKHVVIPEEIDGYPVTTLGSVFRDNKVIETVELPSSVYNFEVYTFYGCSNLKEIELHEGIVHLGTGTFAYCDSLTEVTIPLTVRTSAHSFAHCANLKKVIFKEGMTKIPWYICQYAEAVETVVIPETVTEIGSYAFEYCNIKELNLHEGITKICGNAFCGCTNIEEVTIPSTVISSITSGGGPFQNCTNLKTITFAEGMTKIPDYICNAATAITTINFPSTVTEIGNHSFGLCKALTDVKIPETVKTIDEYAFYMCFALKNVELNEGLHSIENQAFSYCRELESIVIPTTLKACGEDGIFLNCDKLETMIFADGNDCIPHCIAKNAKNLKYIDIPDSVTNTGKEAFFNCTSLESITIPGTLKLIGQSTFEGCSNLKYLTLEYGVENLFGSAFANCDSLESVVIPASIKNRSGWTTGYFNNCKNLTTIKFEEGITEIPVNFCKDMPALTMVSIPSTVTEIKNYAFSGCLSLQKIIIPESVTTIGDNAFSNCSLLDTFVYFGDELTIADDAFKDTSNFTFFTENSANITMADTLNTINFTYADGTLSFSGEYKSDLYYLFDLVAMMCTYYDDVQYLFFDSFEAVSADEGHIYYYTDNWERIEFDGTKITNVKFSVEAFDGEEFRKFSFNELCEVVGNNELDNFNLVVEEADGLDRGNVEISLVDQINMAFQRILKALTNLINKLFSFFKKLGR